MKKALVIGAAGFVGPYLIKELLAQGYAASATKLPEEKLELAGVKVFDLDISDAEAVSVLLREVQADVIFHLAALSSVGLSWKKPDLTVDINIKGTLHVLDAVRGMEKKPRLMLIGSSEEYGPVKPEEIPVAEGVCPRPQSVYAVTKLAQNQLGLLYAKAYGLDVVCTRSFNHIGPTQRPGFVVPDFCRQIAQIEAGAEPVMRVGNLAAQRDFTDVRDVVKAYVELAKHGVAGETYNIGSGRAWSIQALLDLMLAYSAASIDVQVDPARFQPIDVPEIRADITKLQAAIGWQPEIPLEKSIEETLDYWRQEIKKV